MDRLKTSRIFATVLYFQLVWFVAGCDMWESDLEPIEGNIKFSITETYSMNYYDSIKKPDIVLHMVTDQQYGYAGTLILSRFRVGNDKIKVKIKGSSLGMLCVIGPAETSRILDVDEGTYTLEITYDGKTDCHTVYVTDSSIEVNTDDASFTYPEYDLAWRYGINSFAVFESHPNITRNAFIDSVKSEVEIEELFYPDTGYIPYYGSHSTYVQYYSYPQDSDFDVIGGVLENFTKSYLVEYPNATVKVVSWTKKKYSSYNFR